MAKPVTLRCTTGSGDEIAHVVLDASSTFAAAALNAVIGDLPSGTVTAEAFARTSFRVVSDYETRPSLRDRIVLRHLRALDHMALAAVTRDIPATITWSHAA